MLNLKIYVDPELLGRRVKDLGSLNLEHTSKDTPLLIWSRDHDFKEYIELHLAIGNWRAYTEVFLISSSKGSRYEFSIQPGERKRYLSIGYNSSDREKREVVFCDYGKKDPEGHDPTVLNSLGDYVE
ncbi:hypothetical protein TWF694_008970 [Orbilia ellipsospora]|uniref:Uncharacterized protein n=1 Tax=Orbilia ellipsospora TaxID=2528407 RepID=A0AAV9XG88_9PEZI